MGGHLTCVAIDGDKSEDFDAMNAEEDKNIGQNSAEGKAWDDTVYTKDDSKSQVIGDAEAAKGAAEDAAQQKAVADNRAAGYTGHSWGKSEELLQHPPHHGHGGAPAPGAPPAPPHGGHP